MGVRAKPRKPREVTVVELSSSEDEAASELPLHHQLDLSGFIPLQAGSSGRGSKPQDAPSFDPNEPIMILSSDEEEELLQTVTPTSYTAPPAMRMQLNTLMHRKPAVQQEESSSEDDLIVVKTEHCTIDPITKKQITEPVRNKKCNHIYEKATIYGMIEQARAHQKPVRCPYMGCNQKDFKKTDLVKDREVAKHLEEKRDEKERDDLEKAKQEEAKKEARKRKREEEGEQSADSIVEEVISMMRTNRGEVEAEEQEENDSRLEESSGSSQPPSNSSSKSSMGEVPEVENDLDDGLGEKTSSVEPEPSKGKVSRKASKPAAHQMSDSSDSDIPLSKARQKRKKKMPRKLNDSFSGSELEEENSDSEPEDAVRVKKAKKVIKKNPPKKKVKIVTSKDTTTNVKIKKVTETWSISEQKAGGSKRKETSKGT